jgi:hypothetical protein
MSENFETEDFAVFFSPLLCFCGLGKLGKKTIGFYSPANTDGQIYYATVMYLRDVIP